MVSPTYWVEEISWQEVLYQYLVFYGPACYHQRQGRDMLQGLHLVDCGYNRIM